MRNDWRAEKKLNKETFGVAGNRRFNYAGNRGGYGYRGGRGRGYGQMYNNGPQRGFNGGQNFGRGYGMRGGYNNAGFNNGGGGYNNGGGFQQRDGYQQRDGGYQQRDGGYQQRDNGFGGRGGFIAGRGNRGGGYAAAVRGSSGGAIRPQWVGWHVATGWPVKHGRVFSGILLKVACPVKVAYTGQVLFSKVLEKYRHLTGHLGGGLAGH